MALKLKLLSMVRLHFSPRNQLQRRGAGRSVRPPAPVGSKKLLADQRLRRIVSSDTQKCNQKQYIDKYSYQCTVLCLDNS